MAKVFGTPGNFVFAEARRKFVRFLILIVLTVAAFFYMVGLQHGLCFEKSRHSLFISLVIGAVFLTVYLLRRYVSSYIDGMLETMVAFRKGGEGEAFTADAISDLPDTYSVFHDLTHPSIGGNIDHIVVGPTGVFALETKNWRGMVTLSGQGVVTVDGKHDHTRDGKAILGRALTLNKKIEALSNIKTFVQAVMVFPNASVSVAPDTRCALTVLRLDLLENYLKRPSSRPLTPQQVDTITSDLQALFKPDAFLNCL